MPLQPKRTIAELRELRELTEDSNGAQRVAWTPTWLKAREWFAGKLAGLPVEHHYDAAGNNWVTLRGESEKALLIGGHLDSVPNGGWLDGCLDALAALEVLRRFNEEYNERPPLTIRVVDWADEEGARFGRSLLGSSAFAGTHSIAADRARKDKDGIALEDALRECGVDIDCFPEAEKEQKNAAAYLELHLGRSARHERRGAARDYVSRTGSAFRFHSDERAPRCFGRRRETRFGDSLHRGQAYGCSLHDGQREDVSWNRDGSGRTL
jgi:hypothetical protein